MIFFSFSFNFSLSELVLPQNHRFPMFYIQSWGSLFPPMASTSPPTLPPLSVLGIPLCPAMKQLLTLVHPCWPLPSLEPFPSRTTLPLRWACHRGSVLTPAQCSCYTSAAPTPRVCHFIILPLDADPQSSLGAVQGLLCNLHTLLNHLRHICHFNYNLF